MHTVSLSEPATTILLMEFAAWKLLSNIVPSLAPSVDVSKLKLDP